MAARFWQWVLGFELAFGVLIGVMLAATLRLPSVAAVVTIPAAFLAIACLFVLASFIISRMIPRDSSQSPAAARYVLQAVFTELVAFGTAKLAMATQSRGRPPQVSAPPPGVSAHPLMLIHGVACNRAVWRLWFKRLQQAGFAPISAIDLEPLFDDIESHTDNVVQELREMQRNNHGARVAIIAHSMGGLVARAALRAAGPSVISRIVTIGTPHHGTALAWPVPCRAIQQMRRDSRFIQDLNAAQEGQAAVPVATVYSLEDNLVAPARSAALSGARQYELRGLGHLGLLSSPRSIDCAVAALANG